MKIRITNQGTIVGFTPVDDEAREFLNSIGAEPWQFLGETLYVDHRPAQAFIEQVQEDGVEFVE